MFADLHIHTNFSDGICSPNEIINQAIIAGLEKISITDHDIFLGNIEAKNVKSVTLSYTFYEIDLPETTASITQKMKTKL